MDMERQNLIIFIVERKEHPSLFVWVYLHGNFRDKTVRITIINELMLYSKWTGEPMDVSGSFPPEMITEAISKLQNWPEDDIRTELLELNDWMNGAGGDPQWKDDEKAILRNARKAKKEISLHSRFCSS